MVESGGGLTAQKKKGLRQTCKSAIKVLYRKHLSAPQRSTGICSGMWKYILGTDAFWKLGTLVRNVYVRVQQYVRLF